METNHVGSFRRAKLKSSQWEHWEREGKRPQHAGKPASNLSPGMAREPEDRLKAKHREKKRTSDKSKVQINSSRCSLEKGKNPIQQNLFPNETAPAQTPDKNTALLERMQIHSDRHQMQAHVDRWCHLQENYNMTRKLTEKNVPPKGRVPLEP